MTKNLPSKSGYRGSNPKADKKLQQNSNATNHSQNETAVANSAAVLITVQKASIDLKMLTPEQRRLANLMNDKVDVTEIEKKINKIMELTGASKDKAIVALHDCANELDKAIDMILEGDSINESEWKSQARKKKPKASKELEQNSNSGKILNGDAKKGGQKTGGRQIRGKQQQTNNTTSDKQNKFERGATFNKKDRDQQAHCKQPKEPNNILNDESTTSLINNKDVEQVDDKLDEDWPDESPSINNNSNNSNTQRNRIVNNNNNENQFKSSTHKYHQDRDQRRPPNGPRNNYNNRNFGTSGDRNLSDRRNDRGQGERMMDRRPYQNKNYTKKPGNFSNSIDTWSNYTAASDNNPSNNNNDYAQMTVGNWSDVVSSTSTSANVQQNKNEDLNENNEWTEKSTATTNLVDQLTKNNQTPNKPDHHNLPKMPNLASIVSGVKPQIQPQQPVQQQQTAHHKSPNVKQQQPQQSINLSNSNNHQLSTTQHPLTKSSPQQQRQPTQQQTASSTTNQQQQNKIDLAALLKSSSTNQPPQPQQPQSTNEQQMNKLIRGNIQQQQQQRSSNSDTNTYGAALLQRLQQGANNLSDYVNPYSTSNSQQLSSQNKNLVHHIPSTSNYTSQNNPTSALFDNQSHHHNQLQHQQQTTSLDHQKSLIEKKRRQTKIPETAVEMPSSDHISSLNVQFGALDFVGSATTTSTTAADSYLNDHQTSNNEKSGNNSTTASSLLSTVRGNDSKQNISDHQQLQDNILHAAADNRSKQQVQQQSGYQQHINNSYKNENTSSIYPSNLQGYQSSYSVNNYGSQNHQQQSSQSMSSSNQQKINLKDLDTSSSSANNDKQNAANNTSSSSLGNLVNNTTVTTNVLKNSLTATGKNQTSMQQLNVPPNVAPLLGTPQYIMSQPGLSTAFYPVYDMPMAPATDHSFRGYNQNTGLQDVKYTRSDNQDGQASHPVNPGVGQSSQAPVTQTPNHQIFSHIPPYFFYTGMMTQGLQGLYQTPAPIFPVQPNPGPNTGSSQAPHASSNHSNSGFGGPKSAQNQAAPYSAASAYSTSTSYDPITGQLTNQGAQDYNKPQNYTSGPNSANQPNQQTGKQMSNTGSNDLVNNNMYTKSHAQLTKNFDKSGTFQTGTPPPFGIAALGYNPNQFIPMMQPQSNPMLHHSLQGDGSNHNQNNSGVGGNNQRGGSLSQKNTTSNTNKYYWS